MQNVYLISSFLSLKGNSMITLYGYKKCSTCRNAEKNLESRGVAFRFVDITTNPPTSAELAVMQKMSGLPAKKFFNTTGVVYREQNIKEKITGLCDKEIFEMLSLDGKLIKRPLVSDGNHATVGFSAEIFNQFWI